jgi:hypothetical protein
MGYFGLHDEIRYWSVTCKRCREAINFAHFDPKGNLYDQIQCVVAVECPRCLERRRYLHTEIWRHRISETSKVSLKFYVTEPLFIQFSHAG